MVCESKYQINLVPASNISEVSNECLFTGKIEGDDNSFLAVYGCIGEMTTVSIASTLVENGQIDLQVWST